MDRYNERPAPVRGHQATVSTDMHASEPISRLIAYASPYLFWTMVFGLSLGILLM